MFTKTTRLQFWLGLAILTAALSPFHKVMAAPTAVGVKAVTGDSALSAGGGNKVVVTPDNWLHAVYVESGQIKYIGSANGVTWTAPVIISLAGSGNAQAATIAVAGSGANWTLGVAYVDAQKHSPFYSYKAAGQINWSYPIEVTQSYSQAVPQLSMVAFGNDMYLTWNMSYNQIAFASFPAKPTLIPIVAYPEMVYDFCLCGASTYVMHPSIAVTKRSATDNQPLVRVAFLYYNNNQYIGNSGNPYFTVQLAERPVTTGLPLWPAISVDSYTFPIGPNYVSSRLHFDAVSLAANPQTGEFYLGASYHFDEFKVGTSTIFGAFGSTKLFYETAWANSGQWKSHELFKKHTQIDVAATAGTTIGARLFRVAVSEIDTSGFGSTWFRTGQWISGATPIWLDNQTAISAAGRDPQAIFWNKSCYSGPIVYIKDSWRQLFAFFTASVNSSYEIKRASDEGNCNGWSNEL